jgi:hypothetical protein
MQPVNFFKIPQSASQKRYEALRAFYFEGVASAEVAKKFGYTLSAFYSLTRNFKKLLRREDAVSDFFVTKSLGRKSMEQENSIYQLIVKLRKCYISVPDIKATLDAKGLTVSEKHILNIIRKEGFARLPRRSKKEVGLTKSSIKLEAPKSVKLDFREEVFNADSCLGMLCLVPLIKKLKLHEVINNSNYPETSSISRLSSILSFLALKMSNVKRYSADDVWCMARELGLFAGLNVLPKAAWFSSYSHRVTREMNLKFLRDLNNIWSKQGLLSDTVNLDFVSVPYWGDDSHLENNWSGKRNKALASILAVIGNDPDSGIITYADANVRHIKQSDVAVEFLDFYKPSCKQLQYLVFDSKFTTYGNLKKLDENGVKFITIRRRGKSVIEKLKAFPKSEWKTVRVPTTHGKSRVIKYFEEHIFLRDYEGKLRQVAIEGTGRLKPALIITNDNKIKPKFLVHKYARRWIVEKEIAEQTDFFHLNRISSSMVIKVDFDLTMSVLAHNLYRIFASNLEGYEDHEPTALFSKFIVNGGEIKIEKDRIIVGMKKKRNLPLLLTKMNEMKNIKIDWLNQKEICFEGLTYS